MRAIVMAGAAMAALSLAGCDINTGGGTAQNQCHCATAPAATPAPPPADMAGATPPVPVHRHHARHRYAYDGHRGYGGHGYYWRREYSEVSVETYDYHSDSRSYVVGYSAGASSGGAATGGGAWVDGYGRGHGGATDGAPVHYEQGRDRMSPWHGYDADCPDDHR